MKFKSIMLQSASVLVASLLLVSPLASADDTVVGINAAVKGQVTIQSQGEGAKEAIVKDEISLGDSVNSAKVSSLQVLLKDQTVFTVGPECELTIDRFVYDPAQNNNSMQASVKKGMFRFMSGNISKSGPDAVSIDTPVASLGVRGTIVEGLVGQEAVDIARDLDIIPPGTVIDPDGATLFILRGPGGRQTGKNTKGQIRIRSNGGAVTVRRSGDAVFVASLDAKPIGPFALNAATFEVFSERLRTRPTSGAGFRPFDVSLYDLPQADDSVDDVFDNPKDPLGDIFDPLIDLDWPDEDIFDSPCGTPRC